MAFAFTGAGVVTVGVPALVPLFETEALGYQVVMSLFAVVATGLLALAFFSTEEVVKPPGSRSLAGATVCKRCFPTAH